MVLKRKAGRTRCFRSLRTDRNRGQSKISCFFPARRLNRVLNFDLTPIAYHCAFNSPSFSTSAFSLTNVSFANCVYAVLDRYLGTMSYRARAVL